MSHGQDEAYCDLSRLAVEAMAAPALARRLNGDPNLCHKKTGRA